MQHLFSQFPVRRRRALLPASSFSARIARLLAAGFSAEKIAVLLKLSLRTIQFFFAEALQIRAAITSAVAALKPSSSSPNKFVPMPPRKFIVVGPNGERRPCDM